jgi:ABC-2 type transport system permease protein
MNDSRIRAIAVWWGRMKVMTIKELVQLLRDPVLLAFVLYAFTADIYLAGSGVSLELRQAATLVHDGDKSQSSRELARRFQLPHFRLDGEIDDPSRGMQRMDWGDAMIVLDIPPKFEESLIDGRPAAVQMQVDTTNVVQGNSIHSYGEQIISRFGLEAAARKAAPGGHLDRLATIQDDHRVFFNPNQNDSWFMSLTELLNIITLFAIILPAAALAREKERGTVEQLMVTPLSPFEILMPKVLAMAGVILLGTGLCLFGVIRPAFGLPIRGSVPLFLAVTVLYIFTTAGIGMLVAAFARNMAQAGMLIALIYAPLVFLSGAWTPPEALPRVMRLLMTISPLHYYIDASFGILLKGAGIGLLWESVFGMLILGVPAFGLGLWRFRHQIG